MNEENNNIPSSDQASWSEGSEGHGSGGAEIKKSWGFEELAGWGIVALVFLLPIFFVPNNLFPFSGGKVTLILAITLISLLFVVLYFIKKGRVTVPVHPFFLSSLAVLLVYLVSAIFSKSGFVMSIAGYGTETHSFAFLAFLFLLMFIGFYVFQRKERILYALLAIVLSGLILALFFIIRFIFGFDVLSFGMFFESTSNPLGSWVNVGMFFGLMLIVVTAGLEMLGENKVLKVLLYIGLIISLFFLILINIPLIWVAVGLITFLFIVYLISSSDSFDEKGFSFPVVSLIVLFLAIAMMFFGDMPSRSLADLIEVRGEMDPVPTWSSTFSIARETITENPLRAVVGAGPIDFSYQWKLHQPEGVVFSNFWNTEFNSGVGYFPTTLVGVGILGAIAWVSVIFFFFIAIIAALRVRLSDVVSNYTFITSIAVSIFLLFSAMTSPLSHVLLVIMFVFMSVPFAILALNNALPMKTYELSRRSKEGLASTMVLVVVLGALLLFGAFMIQRISSSFFLDRSIVSWQVEEDIERANIHMERAVLMSEQDRYYRIWSEIPLIYIREQVIPAIDEADDVDLITNIIREQFGAALARAERAVQLRDNSHFNWLALGSVNESMIPFNFEGAYEGAMQSYDEALKHAPNNPSVLLRKANVELAMDNVDGAENYAIEALGMKPNFTNAFFFLANMEFEAGRSGEALARLQEALIATPNNPSVYFQIGLLHYQGEDMDSADRNFRRSVTLSPNFDNAWYFYGLTRYEMGEADDAIEIFSSLAEAYPENMELSNILSNMQAGDDAFLGVTSPFDEPTDLPLEEDAPLESEEGVMVDEDIDDEVLEEDE